MSEFGARLKQAREERGISLRQIATATKISMGALEALERDDFSRLPGGIFSRAFVRAYAIEVDMIPRRPFGVSCRFEERDPRRPS
jgi:cytoskeletal protein RodZ